MSDQQPPQDPNQPGVPAGGQPPAGQPPVPPPPPVPPATPPQAYGQPPAPQSGYGAPPPAAPGYQQGQPVPQQNQNATIAFVLAMVTIVLCWIFPVTAIASLIFASKASKEIDQSGGWQTGSGFVTASKVISWIMIALWIIGVIVYVVFFILLIAAGSTVDQWAPSYTPYPTPTGLPG